MKLLILSLHLLCALASEIILAPQDTTGEPVGMVLVGREDLPLEAYSPLVRALQTALAASKQSAYVAVRTDIMGIDITLKNLRTQYKVGSVYWISHGMGAHTTAVHDHVKRNPKDAKALLILGGFLQRTHRPDVVTCLAKAAVQPKKSFPNCILGCLEDGAHTCTGPNIVDFPIPVLTLSGALDGVVRVARVGEAWYTQTILPGSDASKHPVVVVEGMNHAVLLNITGGLPVGVATRDLTSEITQDAAFTMVAGAFADFVAGGGPRLTALQTSTAAFMKPVVAAFVEQEGNWMWTGGDEEHGTSRWAAEAQQSMAAPLPGNYVWKTANEFRLVTDEDKIPPYFRPQHRPQAVLVGNEINTSTVSQLRFLKLSVIEAGIGLNGDAIITEEKLNVLSLADDGSMYSSAIEIATKMASRQLAFQVTGNPDPQPELDDGDRCGDINQAAYDWALAAVSPEQLTRFEKHGLPIKIISDTAPTPPAGPWWIWSYLQYTQSTLALNVQSYKAFYSLDSNPYGAGNHYCKLLSPARALEWVLTDGLRPQYHV